MNQIDFFRKMEKYNYFAKLMFSKSDIKKDHLNKMEKDRLYHFYLNYYLHNHNNHCSLYMDKIQVLNLEEYWEKYFLI